MKISNATRHGLFGLLGMTVLMVQSSGAQVLLIDFEDPTYSVGQAFGFGTANDLPTGSGPGQLNSISYNGSGTAQWTATVTSPINNRLQFFLPGGSPTPPPFSAYFGAAVSTGLAGQSGTWYASFDYTRLTNTGAGLFGRNFGLVNTSGQFLNNTTYSPGVGPSLYNDGIETGYFGIDQVITSFTLDTPYNIRIEVDMGSLASNDGRVYLNNTLLSTFNAVNNSGTEVGGIFFTGDGGNYGATDRGFALDNIEVGQVVPEPSTYGLLLMGLAAFFFIYRRKQTGSRAA